MRIGIDCRLAGPDHAGIGRYTASLVSNLLGISSPFEWVLFCSDKKQVQHLIPGKPKTGYQIILTPMRHYSVAEQVVLPTLLYQAGLDLLHVPHFNVPMSYRKPFFVTIHDLLWHHHRGHAVTTLHPLIYWFKYLGYRIVTNHSVGNSAHIFVPSLEIQQIVGRYYPHAKKKIEVTYEGVELEPKKSVKRKLPKRYILFVGSLYPHKNIAVVLKALQKKPNISLVLVGSRSVFSSEVQTLVSMLGLEKRVLFFGRATEGELHTLYAKAEALIQPSLSEGFGLTGVEAMAAGTPVIASDIAVFHEIYQNAALFFNPHQPESLLSAIEQLSTQRATLLKRGKRVCSRYSWQTLAKQTISAYQRFFDNVGT